MLDNSGSESVFLSSLISQITAAIDSSDSDYPLHIRVLESVRSGLALSPRFSNYAEKVRALFANKLFCVLHVAGVNGLFIVLSESIANVEQPSGKRIYQCPEFKQACLDLKHAYEDSKELFNEEEPSKFVAVSKIFGGKVMKTISALCNELKAVIPEDAFSPPLSLIGVDMDWVSSTANLPNISSLAIDARTGLAFFRTPHGSLSLGNNFLPQMLTSVLYFAYEHHGQCSFSLDPADALNPEGAYQKKVYYPKQLEGTIIGSIMWMADWEMKQLYQGMWYDDQTGIRKPITDIIENLKSAYDFEPESGDIHERYFWRLWFLIDSVRLETSRSDEGLILQASEVKIRVKSMRVEADPKAAAGVKDIETSENDPSRLFAEYITQNFDEIYPKIPSFQKLRNLAILRAFADYIRDVMKVPKSLIKINELKHLIPTVPDDYPAGNVPTISTERIITRKDGSQYKVTLQGGVNLSTSNMSHKENLHLQAQLKTDQSVLRGQTTVFDPKTPFESEEIISEFPVFRIFVPTICSAQGCSTIVTYDMHYFDGSLDPNSYVQRYNWYSYEERVFCLEHHPLRCRATRCLGNPPIIRLGEKYVEWSEKVVFHEHCFQMEDSEALEKRFPLQCDGEE